MKVKGAKIKREEVEGFNEGAKNEQKRIRRRQFRPLWEPKPPSAMQCLQERRLERTGGAHCQLSGDKSVWFR